VLDDLGYLADRLIAVQFGPQFLNLHVSKLHGKSVVLDQRPETLHVASIPFEQREQRDQVVDLGILMPGRGNPRLEGLLDGLLPVEPEYLVADSWNRAHGAESLKILLGLCQHGLGVFRTGHKGVSLPARPMPPRD